MWRIDAIDLDALHLPSYDARGFTVGFGQSLSARLTPRTSAGVTFRLDMIVVERPPLGPCDAGHGCNEAFRPNESGRGGVGFVGAEVVIGSDL